MTHLCPLCFDNNILRRRIEELRRNQKYPSCSFHPTRKGVPIERIAEVVDAVLRANYTLAVEAFEHLPGSSLKELIRAVTGAVDERVTAALSGALIDRDEIDPRDGDMPFYGEDQNYERLAPDGWAQSQLWDEFRFRIIYERRFFNDSAKQLLGEIFDRVHFQADEDKQPACYTIDGATAIHRARRVRAMADAEKIAENVAKKLGPPPQYLRKAGRMNAAGIGAFYGALDEATCLAELRPPVGSLVCMATFRLTRPVRVLDFTRFERPGRHIDLFSRSHAARTTQWAFMQSFQHEISKPVLPDDEHLEYVPAQVVAEYLTSTPVSWHNETQHIEGFVFRSAQRPGGRNLVLFGDAGLVAGGHVPGTGPDGGEFDFADIPSLPSLPPPRPALDYVADSFRMRSITSASFGSEEAHLPSGALDL
jgi:hypothetical protein